MIAAKNMVPFLCTKTNGRKIRLNEKREEWIAVTTALLLSDDDK